jgi:hypothetical protein
MAGKGGKNSRLAHWPGLRWCKRIDRMPSCCLSEPFACAAQLSYPPLPPTLTVAVLIWHEACM